MIEFRGEMSERCKRYIVRREGKHGFISGLIAAVLFTIPTVLISVFDHWAYSLFLPVFLLLPVLAGIPPYGKGYDYVIPTQVTIDRGVITSKGKKFCYSIMADHVKVVVDMGEWYHIFFYYRYRCQRFVCEKKLIYSGTLKEFEKLFANKLIKKDENYFML